MSLFFYLLHDQSLYSFSEFITDSLVLFNETTAYYLLIVHDVQSGHMEKQETEMKWKLETENRNGNTTS